MSLKILLEELSDEGYSQEAMKEDLNFMGLDLSTYKLRTILVVHKPEIVKEYQYTGKRKWHDLVNILPKSEFVKWFNKDARLRQKEMAEEFNLTIYELDTLRKLYFNRTHADIFPKDVTKQIFEADDYTCQLCRRNSPELKMDTHHIIPVGGEHFENGITLCHRCHIRKIHRDKVFAKIGSKYDRNNWNQFLVDNNIKSKFYEIKSQE